MSPTTAHKVVAQLKDSGFLASRPGIGMVVTSPQLPSREDRMNHLEPLCRALANEAAQLNLNFDDVIEALRQAMNGSAETDQAKEESNGE